MAQEIQWDETLSSQRTEQANYEQTAAIIDALDRGMTEDQIAAALEQRPPTRLGRTLYRCPRCQQSGYAGSYPFSTGYPSGLCDDCGG